MNAMSQQRRLLVCLMSSIEPVVPNLATALLALEAAAIRAVAVNLRPSNRHRVHDFGDTLIRWHVCIFCCNPVRDIQVKPVIWRMAPQSISPFSPEFAHSNRSPD